jgi:phosphoglycerate dehydrogenase-like enzyme
VTKILTPQQLAPVMEIARELLPPGMELVVVDPTKPEFYDVAADAEYYLGSPRHGIGNEFFRAAPELKLVQLTSAGYDRVDVTPHSAGPTWDNWAKAYRNGFDNVQRVEEGRAPFWVVPELRS